MLTNLGNLSQVIDLKFIGFVTQIAFLLRNIARLVIKTQNKMGQFFHVMQPHIHNTP
jgi:hypothetical protein